MNEGLLIVVSGPAGSGKGTVLAKVFEKSNGFAYSVSSTTRAPRPGEENGVHYNFVTGDEFEKMLSDDLMLEHTVYCGNYYGTSKAAVNKELKAGKNVILEIEVDGAMQIKKKYPEAVLILVIPPDFKTLEARLRGRGTDSDADIKKRLERAESEMKLFDCYDYFIVNEDDKLDEAADALIGIVNGEKHATKRDPDFYNKFFN